MIRRISTPAPFAAWWSPIEDLVAHPPHPDDVALAARRLRPRAQSVLLARRTLLRQAIAQFCPAECEAIQLVTTGEATAAFGGRLPVYLSVASTECAAICALSRSAPVGIDLEANKAVDDLTGLLERFHVSERNAILALPAASRRQAFLALWTAKESLVKVSGLTLDAALGCEPFILDGEAGETRWRSRSPETYAIFPIAMTGYVAAACVAFT